MKTLARSSKLWPPPMVFSWRWLFYSTAVGVVVGGIDLALTATVEGAAIALGIAIGLGAWLGYPLGLRAASVLLVPVHQLLHMTLERIDWLAAEYQIALPEPSDTEKPKGIARLVAPALYVYGGATVLTAIAVVQAGFISIAGLDTTWSISILFGGTALVAYSFILLAVLWLRGRTEMLALALRHGTQRASRVAFSVNRRLHLV